MRKIFLQDAFLLSVKTDDRDFDPTRGIFLSTFLSIPNLIILKYLCRFINVFIDIDDAKTLCSV